MRLLIASTFLPPISGGAEHVAWELAQRLAQMYDVHVLTTGNKRCTIRAGRLTIHFVIRLPLLTLLYSTVANSTVKTIVGSVQPDIIHSHMALPWGYVFRNEKAKRVITCHGSDVFPPKGYPRRFFLGRALHESIATVPSRWLQKYVWEQYSIKSIVIPNGVDTKKLHPLQNHMQQKLVLFVGRFTENKGIRELAQVARTLQEYEFWLVGGTHAPREMGDLPNVRVVGLVSHNQIADYYARADLCLFPSHHENFPLVGLEAMACGKAVVASGIGFSEYIEQGVEGMLVRPGDLKGIVLAVRRLMENHDLRRNVEHNALSKAKKYDWNRIVREYQALYEGL
jgi:glycosyltransferase involved in cell wall biosynthesis